jgi:Tol biopolymer transport system component
VPITADLPGAHRRPRWSPDGTRLLFQAARGIWVVPSLGGVARPVVEAPATGPAALYPAWSPDGRTLAWVQGDTIRSRPVDGGDVSTIGVLHDAHSLAWSPDGRWIAAVQGNAEFLYGAVNMAPGQTSIGNAAPCGIWLVPVGGGAPVQVSEGTHLHTSPEWLDAHRLVFVSDRDGTRDLFVARIDDDGHSRGPAERLTTGLGALSVGVAANGSAVAYTLFTQRANVWALPIPAAGPVGTAGARPVTTGTQVVEGLDVSPDGRWLAFDADRTGHEEIFRVSTACVSGASLDDAGCGEPERIVEGLDGSFRPAWAPDGRTIVFYAFERGVRHAFSASAQGAAPRPLLPASWGEIHSPVLSPDGRRLTFHRDLATGSQLYETVRTAGEAWSPPRQLTRRGGWGGRWSPDGTRLVYLALGQVRLMGPSGESDSRALYDTATAGPEHPWPVSLRWAPDGRTVYMKAFDAQGTASLWALPAGCVPADGAGCGAPRLLVRFDEPHRPARRPEFATDGARFYFTLAERESDLWLVELARR